ncbi:DUF4185 domain-containing protein [Pararhodonellum marinum]|uniref:DUF4185 domain-containing protein n=1 Tax=Pararhodonellum marinum TaxID=2755358 RepID=UPI00188FF114|nr:DUF4185 domain-containing protein [Pararhodonellum marinum]
MKKRDFIPILISISLLQACQKDPVQIEDKKNNSISELNFTAEEAPEWSDLFHRSSGWFGGDGIFVIPMNGVDSAGSGENGQTLILFSDTLIGEIEDGQLGTDYKMINNSVAILDGIAPSETDLKFYWDENEKGEPKSIFIPQTPQTNPGDYFWLGDGFINHEKNNDIYIFGYRITNTEAETFAFKEVGNTLIVIPSGSNPPFANQRQLDTPFYFEGNPESTGSFGAGIMVNTTKAGAPHPDGYVYVYGIKGIKKEVLVARVLPQDFEDFSEWRFWDGDEWQPEMDSAAAIADRASNEMSVTALKDGRYAMVFQTDGIGTTVGLRLALSPEGPYGPMIQLWDAVEDVNVGEQFISYNAKVHSNLSKPGELLISYNINSFDFFNEILVHPNLYRPRFIRVKLLD